MCLINKSWLNLNILFYSKNFPFESLRTFSSYYHNKKQYLKVVRIFLCIDKSLLNKLINLSSETNLLKAVDVYLSPEKRKFWRNVLFSVSLETKSVGFEGIKYWIHYLRISWKVRIYDNPIASRWTQILPTPSITFKNVLTNSFSSTGGAVKTGLGAKQNKSRLMTTIAWSDK